MVEITGYIEHSEIVGSVETRAVELVAEVDEFGPPGETPYIKNGHWWIGNIDTGVNAKGDKGDTGEQGLTPYIGENGDWWIGETDTGVYAGGEAPYIGENGHWYIGQRDTGVKARGDDGLPIISYCVRRIDKYLYEASYDNIPEYVPTNAFFPNGCTSFVRGGRLYRNLDWNYAETAEFRVITHDFKGMAFMAGVDDGTIEHHRAEIEQLPYHIVDGRNNDGIMVSTHVLFNDFDYDGEGDKSVNIQLLPYLILMNLHSMNDIQSLNTYLQNLFIPIKMKEIEYLCQFLVTDGITTYVITPSENGYELVDISANPKLTNFKWVNRATVARTDSDIQLRPTGIERWNAIDEDTTLEDLRFTKAYETPDYLSEFIGIDGTTKDSTDEELMDIYNRAHAEYLVRERDGKTWQTIHSVVYSAIGMEDLWVQEDYVHNYTDIPTILPPITSADEGKVLGVVNGALAWVTASTPTPPVEESFMQYFSDPFGDGSYLVISYEDIDQTVGIRELFEGATVEGRHILGYWQETGRTATGLEALKINSILHKSLTQDDLDFCSEDLFDLVDLDLSEADMPMFGESALEGDDHIKRLVMPNNLVGISDRAFYGSRLEGFYSSTVQNIGESAFEGCTALQYASMPACEEIGHKAFYGCTALDAVNAPACTTYETDDSLNADTFGGTPSLIDLGIPSANEIHRVVDHSAAYMFAMRGDNLLGATLPVGFIVAPNEVNDACVYLCPGAYSEELKGIVGDWVSPVYDFEELEWIHDDGEGLEQKHYTVAGFPVTISEIGFGEYLAGYDAEDRETKIYRFVGKIVGRYEMPDLYRNREMSVGKLSFCGLRCSANYTAESTNKPILILSKKVTNIFEKGFYACGLTGVQGDSVRFLGYAAFQNSPELRWAKFINCNELGKDIIKNGDAIKRYQVFTFRDCPKFAVFECGFLDLYTNYPAGVTYKNTTIKYNTFGLLYNCMDFKLIVIHTENIIPMSSDIPSFNRNIIGNAAFMLTENDSVTAPSYSIIISNLSNIGRDYSTNNPYSWAQSLKEKMIITKDFSSADYQFAEDVNQDQGFTRITLANDWHLADIGYGDYICEEKDNGTAILHNVLLPLGTNRKQNITATANGHIYETPNETVSGLPITEIGDYTFAQVVFGTAQSPVPIRLADNTVTVGTGAFLGQYCSCPSYGSTPDVKHFKNIDLNRVQTVKAFGFGGYEPQLEKVTAYALQTLESNSLVCIYSGSNPVPFTTIELYTPNRVQANSAFGASSQSTPAVPPANLRVKVYAAVYNDTVNGYSADDFGYFYGDEKYWDAGYKILLALEGDKAHFELLEE